jgi:hypothetical protein
MPTASSQESTPCFDALCRGSRTFHPPIGTDLCQRCNGPVTAGLFLYLGC